MSTADLVALAGFAALFLMMLLRVPIGIAMALVGIGGFAAIAGWSPALNLLATSPVRTVTDYNLSLIPMFILMGVFATASGMSTELFRAGHAWLGRLRGGLALATIGACGGFAAICGSSVATAATMSNIALPEMRRFGYRDDVATGVIAAGGTLGILIPPSVVLAVYAFITEQDVGRLFIAGIVPGLLALAMYMATVRLAYGRTLPPGEPIAWPARLASLRGIWAVHAAVRPDHRRDLCRGRDPDRGRGRGRLPHRPDRRAAPPPRTAPRSWPAWSRRCAPRLRSSPS